MEEIKKLYFTTGDAAKELGVSVNTVNTWLNDYGIVTKRSAGRSKLTREQIDKLKLIKALTKEFGMKHEGVKKFLEQNGWKTYGQYEVIPSFTHNPARGAGDSKNSSGAL